MDVLQGGARGVAAHFVQGVRRDPDQIPGCNIKGLLCNGEPSGAFEQMNQQKVEQPARTELPGRAEEFFGFAHIGTQHVNPLLLRYRRRGVRKLSGNFHSVGNDTFLIIQAKYKTTNFM